MLQSSSSMRSHGNHLRSDFLSKLHDTFLYIHMVKYINGIIFQAKSCGKYFKTGPGLGVIAEVEWGIDPHQVKMCFKKCLQLFYFFYEVLLVFQCQRIRENNAFYRVVIKRLG